MGTVFIKGGRIETARDQLKPGPALSGIHSHDGYEILCCESGHAHFFCEGLLFRAQAGDMMLLNSDFLHSFKCGSETGAVLWRINFDSSVLEGLLPGKNCLQEIFSSKREHCLIRQEGVSARSASAAMIECVLCGCEMLTLSNFLKALFHLKELRYTQNHVSLHSETHVDLRDILEYIDCNLTDDLSIASLSRKFFISQQHILKLFKDLAGGTLHGYINCRRLILAKENLRKGQSVSFACENSGFRDYSNFIRLFKAKTGISPGRYSRNFRDQRYSEIFL